MTFDSLDNRSSNASRSASLSLANQERTFPARPLCLAGVEIERVLALAGDLDPLQARAERLGLHYELGGQLLLRHAVEHPHARVGWDMREVHGLDILEIDEQQSFCHGDPRITTTDSRP